MGVRDEHVDDLVFSDQTAEGNPAEEGIVRRVSGDIVAFIGGSVKSLTSGAGGGLTPTAHRDLDQLVHGVAETSEDEYVYSGRRITRLTTWTDVTKTTKIRESLFTYASGRLQQVVTTQHDAAGTVVETLTETYAYTGARVTSISRVLT